MSITFGYAVENKSTKKMTMLVLGVVRIYKLKRVTCDPIGIHRLKRDYPIIQLLRTRLKKWHVPILKL